MARCTKDGKSSMLTNIKVNQPRDNSMRSLVFMLKEISMLYQKCRAEDTWT
jgi:hypothetical protein